MDQFQLRDILREALASKVDHLEDVNDDLFVETGRRGFVIRIRPWHPGFHTPMSVETTLSEEAGHEREEQDREGDPER